MPATSASVPILQPEDSLKERLYVLGTFSARIKQVYQDRATRQSARISKFIRTEPLDKVPATSASVPILHPEDYLKERLYVLDPFSARIKQVYQDRATRQSARHFCQCSHTSSRGQSQGTTVCLGYPFSARIKQVYQDRATVNIIIYGLSLYCDFATPPPSPPPPHTHTLPFLLSQLMI